MACCSFAQLQDSHKASAKELQSSMVKLCFKLIIILSEQTILNDYYEALLLRLIKNETKINSASDDQFCCQVRLKYFVKTIFPVTS